MYVCVYIIYTHTGSRAYAGQKAFIMTGTIRENILFHLPYHKERYTDALARAQLLPDLAHLALGDATVVGTGGAQLSGGQRARVALARVLYADADVVFLDDIMSALDAHTGAAVWANALCWFKARGKTVVLVTHQLQLLQREEVDLVALVQRGRLAAVAPYKQLMASSASSSDLLSHLEAMENTSHDLPSHELPSHELPSHEVPSHELPSHELHPLSPPGAIPSSGGQEEEEEETLGMRSVVRIVRASLTQLHGRRVDQDVINEACRLAALHGADCTDSCGEGRKCEGIISLQDLRVYLGEFGNRTLILILILVTLSSALLSVAANVYLATWTDNNSHCIPVNTTVLRVGRRSLFPMY
jgi:ABC-type multidrug transport system ATPase subunit